MFCLVIEVSSLSRLKNPASPEREMRSTAWIPTPHAGQFFPPGGDEWPHPNIPSQGGQGQPATRRVFRLNFSRFVSEELDSRGESQLRLRVTPAAGWAGPAAVGPVQDENAEPRAPKARKKP